MDARQFEIYRRSRDWRPEYFIEDAALRLARLDIGLQIDDIYADMV